MEQAPENVQGDAGEPPSSHRSEIAIRLAEQLKLCHSARALTAWGW